MHYRFLSWIFSLNLLLFLIAFFFALSGVGLWLENRQESSCSLLSSQECPLPKHAFEFKEEVYQEAGHPFLKLDETPPKLQLPDLKGLLIYYGKNGRPDAVQEETKLHFATTANNKQIVSIRPGEKLYLVYDGKNVGNKYLFSPENAPSSLWIIAKPLDNEVEIKVGMQKENGEAIDQPQSLALFRLAEKELSRFGGGSSWEIGPFKADATLLSKQKAKWVGKDRFLERHGGEEFPEVSGRERIDFGEKEQLYFVFGKAGDCFIYEGDQWKRVDVGPNSVGRPLLCLKKVDERLMTFELWDAEGKSKVILNLLKSQEPWTPQNSQVVQNQFKFLGAKTKSQCVFEVGRERMVVKPSEWLLLSPQGWKKLTTEEAIDNYVKRKEMGALFVFEGIEQKAGKSLMKGCLYSPSRHDYTLIEFPLVVKSQNKDKKPLPSKPKNPFEKQ